VYRTYLWNQLFIKKLIFKIDSLRLTDSFSSLWLRKTYRRVFPSSLTLEDRGRYFLLREWRLIGRKRARQRRDDDEKSFEKYWCETRSISRSRRSGLRCGCSYGCLGHIHVCRNEQYRRHIINSPLRHAWLNVISKDCVGIAILLQKYAAICDGRYIRWNEI